MSRKRRNLKDPAVVRKLVRERDRAFALLYEASEMHYHGMSQELNDRIDRLLYGPKGRGQ